MAVNKNFVVRNGLEVSENLIYADDQQRRIGVGIITARYDLDVIGGIGATTVTSDGSIVTGLSTSNNNKIDGYSFKKIIIKKGFQTSLQFHIKKKETNFLFDGLALLYHSNSRAKKNNSKNIRFYKKKKLNRFSSVTIERNSIHRIKALSNLTLYEISTPELSDVVRVIDDSNRKNGRIIAEHQ